MNAPPVKDLLNFSDKVVLVTGSSSGLGQGIALRFAEAGAKVVIHYNSNPNQAQQTVRQIIEAGGQAIAFQADLSQQSQVNQLISQTIEKFTRLDVLINNAGIYPLASLLEMSLGQWDSVISTNLSSVFLCTQAAAKQMIEQGNGGAIVNISSIEAENPAPLHSHYNASKAGVLMFTRSAAQELGNYNIRVNAVAPGLIWREGLEQAWPEGVARWQQAAPLQRLGQPDDIADACLFLASPAARWITGTSLTVDGGVMTHQIF